MFHRRISLPAGSPDDLLHGRAQPKLDQHAGAIGGKLDACADLAQLDGLLEELDLVAVAQQGERGGQAAYAGAGDQDAGHGVAPFGWPGGP